MVQGGADFATTESLRFGPFLLRPGARVLELDGQRVPLGGRAFDILTTLVERAGEVVSQKDLYERVWPGLNVNEASLRVQIRALRVALGAGDGAVTYVSNIPARGYCFVAPVSGGPPAAPPAEASPPPIAPQTNLPRPVDAFVGRQSELADLDERFFTQRLITLVGPGGNGKSRLAVELGWRLCERFSDGVWFVDLAPVANDEFGASAIAAAIGGDLHSAVSAGETLAASIGRRRMLLILDNCERLVRPIADLADVLLQKTPALSILATRRCRHLRSQRRRAFRRARARDRSHLLPHDRKRSDSRRTVPAAGWRSARPGDGGRPLAAAWSAGAAAGAGRQAAHAGAGSAWSAWRAQPPPFAAQHGRMEL
jgi:DNA-binding winged helix-turn-helix (wHTH) protein